MQQNDGTMNQEVSRTISNYFKTQPVEKAWVFGSFSRGEERADSDVDIMITLTANRDKVLVYARA